MRRALLAFLVTRVLLLGVLVIVPPVASWWVPEGATSPWQGSSGAAPLEWQGDADRGWYLYCPSRPVDAWFRFDSGWYLEIAALGYGRPPPAAMSREGFFPGYPAAMRLSRPLARWLALPLRQHLPAGVPAWPLAAGLLVSNLAALSALVLLVMLARRVLPAAAAERVGVVFACQPFAFLWSAGLSEGLFFFLVAAAFLAESRRRDDWAGLAAAGASFTRLPGVLLLLPLIGSLLQRRRKAGLDRWLWLALPPVGLLLALIVIGREAGGLRAYFDVQARFGHTGFPSLEGVRRLFVTETLDAYEHARDFLQVAVLVSAVGLTVVQAVLTRRGRLPWPWLPFTVAMLALPLFSGSVISLPRYCIVLLPLYLVAGCILPGGWRGWLLAVLGCVSQGLLLLGFEAHLPLVI